MKLIAVIFFIGFSLSLANSKISYSADFNSVREAYVSGDYTTALSEFKKLAAKGNANGQFMLGLMHQHGQGTLQDYEEAVKWYQISAESGHAYAQANLGDMFSNGQGVPQSYMEAARFYRLSAEQGFVLAMAKLGAIYLLGEGVLQDNIYAYMWLNIAASNGNKSAAEFRESIAMKMTTSDISTAQKLARECISKSYRGC